MGSLCTAPRRGKVKEKERNKHDQESDEVSATAESEDKSTVPQITLPVQEEGGTIATITGEENSRMQEESTSSEKHDRGEKSSNLSTVIKVNTPSSCLLKTHDAASAITEEMEAADWVDNNQSKLIQNITSVMAIADEMVQRKIIHEEIYADIKAAKTSQKQMRELLHALRYPSAKYAFFRILREIQPEHCDTEDFVQGVMEKHKASLSEKYKYEFEGTDKDRKDIKSLEKIYTELHIIQGESERVNKEHEIWEIEDKSRSQTSEGTKINCNDIFKCVTENSISSETHGQEVRAIRTVMTKGIAGIGKTVSVKKFILDWANGTANQDLDFIFVLPFRELNLVIDDALSLETLVKDFHPEVKNLALARIFCDNKVLFILDGLDESQLQLNFKTTKRLTDATKESSVDTLVTNLIREHLLPSALVWVTSRPGAVQRIPRECIHQWTEVRGFNDSQKIEYFKRRVEDKAVAERIISTIMKSRSLFIMCHIPIFCWIAAKVLAYLLLKKDNTQDENIEIPTTLTEMYTHFLCIQMKIAADKYNTQDESDAEEIFKPNEEFILKLGRMSFEQLKEGRIVFTVSDLKSYGIDIQKAGVHCGLCTEILKEESVFNKRKLFCFVHLTIQEYFAGFFVYHSFASKKIDSLSLKDFMLGGSEEELKLTLDADPVDLPLDELIEISIANSTLRKTGELDMFLRFLIGMTVKSTQDLLQGLIQQTEEHSAVVEEVKTTLKNIDLGDCSPERCVNLVQCLWELKDSSIHETVLPYLKPNHYPETQLSPVQCSALADVILMSNTPLEEFNLKKYRPSAKGVFRLFPGMRNSRKARISGVWLSVWFCETISSALRMQNSVLTELHLTNGVFDYNGIPILTHGLMNSQCKLEALSLSGGGFIPDIQESVVSAIKSVFSNLRELELSGNVLGCSLSSVLSDGLGSLEKLRLNRNPKIAEICQMLVTALTTKLCNLRELELNYTDLRDSEMEILCSGLMSTNCNLGVLSLSHNRVTDKGCKMLALALSSKPSNLTELDLSYNDLQDSGVMELCSAVVSPHCVLKALRLSFCKVTGDGCAALAEALRSDHCCLKELDLSFNHLADHGVEMLTEIQKDACCSLEKLNVDQNEEFWFDLQQLRQYACELTLDPNTAGVNVIVTEENKMATYIAEQQPYPENPERFDCCQVLCEEGLTSRRYWEVECDSGNVGVAYKSIDRQGDWSSEFSFGKNEKSWCWRCNGSFNHNNSCLRFLNRTNLTTIGVYLDWPAGILAFFEVFPDAIAHLYTLNTTFTEPLHPAFGLDDGSVRICKIE